MQFQNGRRLLLYRRHLAQWPRCMPDFGIESVLPQLRDGQAVEVRIQKSFRERLRQSSLSDLLVGPLSREHFLSAVPFPRLHLAPVAFCSLKRESNLWREREMLIDSFQVTMNSHDIRDFCPASILPAGCRTTTVVEKASVSIG